MSRVYKSRKVRKKDEKKVKILKSEIKEITEGLNEFGKWNDKISNIFK